MFKVRNITEGKLETIIGIILILAGIASVFLNKSDWTGAAVVITIGTGLLFTKLNSGTGTGAAMIALTLFCSCAKPPVLTKSTVKDSIVTVEKHFKDTVLVPGDSVTLFIQTPCKELAGKTFKAKSKKGNATSTATFDNEGKATIECDCTPYQHEFERLEREKIVWHSKEDVYIQEINKPWPWYVKWALAWTIFSIGASIVLLIIAIRRTF